MPHLRDLAFEVASSIGGDQLTGIPVDLAFDNMRNYGGLPNFSTPFSQGTPVLTNGKGLVRSNPGLGIVNTTEPAYLFAAIPNSTQGGGAIDVISLGSGNLRVDTNQFQAGVQSIPCPGVTGLMDYFRQ